MLSLKQQLTVGFIAVLIYAIGIIALALSLPSSQFDFTVQDNQLMIATASDEPLPIKQFVAAEQELAAAAALQLDEPDVLPTYAELNRFFATHSQLHQALTQGQLVVITATAEQLIPKLQSRTLVDLPGMFWLQLFCGVAGMMICLMVWMPATRDPAITAFAFTGLSNLMFTSAAAVYSTRDFFIEGSTFAWLSGMNHSGALLFSASLAVFLWNYPVKRRTRFSALLFYGLFAAALAVDQMQLTASPVTGFHSWVMLIFLAGLVGSGWQWWQTRAQTAQRAALRWVVLSILAGTLFFAGGMILPAILQTAPPAPQGLLFTTFLLMYAGIALGVGKYRLFNLDRWWFALWSWLLGGVLVILTDLLLVWLLSLSNATGLVLAVALVGWVYFPLRQWVWRKLTQRDTAKLEDWLATALPVMLNSQRDATARGLEKALHAVFKPLVLARESTPNNATQLAENGKSLLVYDSTAATSWRLEHAAGGERLFSRQDEHIANLVVSLHHLVQQVDVAYAEGALEERHRIRRDMHDDLGAKLLHLLHKSPAESQPLVREAIHDLRNLLRDMEGESLTLAAAAAHWYEETQRRCHDHGIELDWQAQVEAQQLNIQVLSELTRIIREAVSNALKHAATQRLRVQIDADEQGLNLVIQNNGVIDAVQPKESGGLINMRMRAQKLGGTIAYQTVADNWLVKAAIPWRSA